MGGDATGSSQIPKKDNQASEPMPGQNLHCHDIVKLDVAGHSVEILTIPATAARMELSLTISA
jgi:hypothetical protein